jgi:hypothetical protein
MPDLQGRTDTLLVLRSLYHAHAHTVISKADERPKSKTYLRIVCAKKDDAGPARRFSTVLYEYCAVLLVVRLTSQQSKSLQIVLSPRPMQNACAWLDLENFYLNTPMARYEYVRIHLKVFSPEVIQQYKLESLADEKGFVMCEIRKGIYGLPQAGILAKQLLKERLTLGGYHEAPNTTGLFTHEHNGISFTLWVDDFTIKYSTIP